MINSCGISACAKPLAERRNKRYDGIMSEDDTKPMSDNPKMRHKRRFGSSGRKGASVQDALQRFFERHKGHESFHLLHLWDNWPMVMGEALCAMAHPLGAKDRLLIIGVEDNLAMHELSFQVPQILARANAFMNEQYFRQVRLELLQKRKPLYPRLALCRRDLTMERPKPSNLGRLKDSIDPNSAAGRAYLSYVESFEGKK